MQIKYKDARAHPLFCGGFFPSFPLLSGLLFGVGVSLFTGALLLVGSDARVASGRGRRGELWVVCRAAGGLRVVPVEGEDVPVLLCVVGLGVAEVELVRLAGSGVRRIGPVLSECFGV